MRRTRTHAESAIGDTSASADSGASADDRAATAAKRPCTTETWRVQDGKSAGEDLPVDYEYLDIQAKGVHVTRYDDAGCSEQHFVINAKAIDAGNDPLLGPQAREFYAGADLSIILWTVREGWGVFGAAEADKTAEGEVEGEVEVEVEVQPLEDVAVSALPSSPPQPHKEEWLCRRDFVEIIGFDSGHFGSTRWIELPPPDDIDDGQVHSLACRDDEENAPVDGVTFRNWRNHLWTARVRQAAASTARTLYVANRLAGMGVSVSCAGGISFSSGVLGETFKVLANDQTVSITSEMLAHFAVQSQFIHTATSKWEAIGLAAPMTPFPFGRDAPERQAFEGADPAWYVPVMAFFFRNKIKRANAVTPRVSLLNDD
jgi:hypothetical protein